jgi:Gluconate 2-dehydrogenase subunit 3
MMTMTRREALLKMAVALGATVAGPRLLAAAFQPGPPAGFTPADLALLDEIGDTIIPPTHVPGAKAAGIGAFMAMMINDCYEAADQAVFKAGLAKLPADYAAKYHEPFLTGQPANRTAFLNELDREQRTHSSRIRKERREAGLPENGGAPHYFRLMKELTLLGYFTSEIGSTQAMRYLEVPGSFNGDAPYVKGDPDYADPIA